MTKPMRYRELAARLKAAGFTPSEGKSDHERWTYPGIDRPVIITQSRDVSPALVRKALKAIEKKEGRA